MNSTIQEKYKLPSRGKFNGLPEDFVIRSMTTQEEKLRLGSKGDMYKIFADIIDACVVEPKNINSYTLCLADFQYLLYKLRIVTYGSQYKFSTICPHCGQVVDETVNLDTLPEYALTDKLDDQLNIVLPRNGDRIRIKLLTPRDWDYITNRANMIKTENPEYQGSAVYPLSLQMVIDTVNGEKLSDPVLEKYVSELSALDGKYIQHRSGSIKLGIKTDLQEVCKNCNTSFRCALPISSEFFEPSFDD